jgi:hypothetical protein
VKSIGVNSLVVILPSTVMAKVAATNGRLPRNRVPVMLLLAGPWLEIDLPLCFLFFFLGDFMLEGGELLLHLAHFHVAGSAAWFVKQINDSTR